MSETRDVIRLEPTRLVRVLAAITVALTLAYVALVLVKTLTGHDHLYGLLPLLDLDKERNIPSFFSGCLFLLNVPLFVLVAKTPAFSASRITWLALAGLFVFLAFDELFGVHERLTVPLREALRTSGFLSYAWVLVYVPAVGLLGCLFLPVWRRLASPVRVWLGLAAGTYLLGAVAVETAAGAYLEAVGQEWDLTYGLLVTVEESLEMAGLVMLTHALLRLLRRESGGPLIAIQNRD